LEHAGSSAHQVKHHERGDLFYFTLPTKDLARAQAFYGAVLGWEFVDTGAGHVENIAAPPGGLHPDGPDEVVLWFVVDDIHAGVAAVRAAGGTAQEPVLHDSGWDAECTDDQGTRFHLSVPAAKYTR
jgi:predicted enzyme related to lactoylglutathione lyase